MAKRHMGVNNDNLVLAKVSMLEVPQSINNRSEESECEIFLLKSYVDFHTAQNHKIVIAFSLLAACHVLVLSSESFVLSKKSCV